MAFPSEREDIRWLSARNIGSVPIPSFDELDEEQLRELLNAMEG